MNRAIALGICSTLVAALGCDPEGGPSDGDAQFRTNIGYLQTQTTTTSFSSKGCDNPFDDYGPEHSEREWQDMMFTQARMVAEETLVAAFLAQRGVEEFCNRSCEAIRSEWDGGAVALESDHAFGDIEVVGECPMDTLATAIPTRSRGEMACTCY